MRFVPLDSSWMKLQGWDPDQFELLLTLSKYMQVFFL